MSLESRIAALESENAELHKQVVEKDSQIAVLKGNQYQKLPKQNKCNHDAGICTHPISPEACHDEMRAGQNRVKPELTTVILAEDDNRFKGVDNNGG